jgi:integrase
VVHRVSKFKALRKSWPRIYDFRCTRLKCLMVDARLKRRGQRFYYKTLDEARVKAEALATERAQNGVEALEFSTELRVMATTAAAKLKPFAKSLLEAADHYVKFLESESAKHNSLSVEECVDRYLAARRRDHERGELSKRSLREVTGRANQLRAAFVGLHVRELDAKRMRDFLDSYPVTARTRTSIRARASCFFNWLRDQGLIDVNPVERLRFRVPESEIKILAVNQVENLLHAVEASGHGDLVAFVALSLWGFMRVGEVHQLRWECVDVANRTIEVKACTSKVRRRRFIEIGDSLATWLAPMRRDCGPVIQPNFRRRWRRATKGLNLSANVLRHSAISYGLSFFANRAWLSEQAGTSPRVVATSYLNAVPKVIAEQLYALRPTV